MGQYFLGRAIKLFFLFFAEGKKQDLSPVFAIFLRFNCGRLEISLGRWWLIVEHYLAQAVIF